MAKSLRSKWRRKCRAVKREKYAVKELARLKKMLGVEDPENKTNNDEVMKDLTITLDAAELKKQISKKITRQEIKLDEAEDSDMEEIVVKKDGDTKTRIYNSKTMKDQYGCYPVWMSQRKIKTLKGGKNKRKNSTHKISKKGRNKRRK